MERATTLLNQSATLRSLMLLSGENGVGKSALAGRWLRSLEPKAYFPVCNHPSLLDRNRIAVAVLAKTR